MIYWGLTRLLRHISVAANGCWEWTGVRRYGYGKFHETVERGRPRRQVLAHRRSWELHNGPIPGGMHVLHRCDNPPCINPAHLFLGTPADNMRDKMFKGRAGGSLRTEDIPAIRAALAAGRTQAAIAAEYGVWQTTISRVALGERWSWVS